MSTSATLTQGTELRIELTPGSAVYTKIPEVTSISGPDATKAEITVTDFDSQAQEYVGGLPDFGRSTVELNYRGTNTTHQALFGLFKDTTSPVRKFREVFIDGTTWEFSASIFSFAQTLETNNVRKVSMVLRHTGTISEL